MSVQTHDDDNDVTAVEVTHSPARFSSALAVAAGLLAALAGGLVSGMALAIGLFGLGGIAAGLFALDSQRFVSAGTALVFVAVLLGGVLGNPAELVLLATLATIVAFDLGQNAFSVGAQLSDETDTRRGELVHAATTVAIGTLASAGVYAVYLVSASGQAVATLAFLLLGAVLLVWAVHS